MAANITAYQIPLVPQPQRLTVQLLGKTYLLRTRWSNASAAWTLDIADQDNNPIVGSIPLVTGADLLGQYGYLGIGGSLWVQETSGPPDTVPSFASLGNVSQLLFIPTT